MFACSVHPFKPCTYLNKDSQQLQCPSCLFPERIQNQLQKSSLMNSPLQENDELIDVEEVAFMAKSFLKEENQQQAAAEVFQAIEESVKSAQEQAHELVDRAFVRVTDSVRAYLSSMPTADGHQIAQMYEEISSPGVDLPQYIQSVSQLHEALRAARSNVQIQEMVSGFRRQLDEFVTGLLASLAHLMDSAEFIANNTAGQLKHSVSLGSTSKQLSVLSRTFAKETIESVTRKELKCSLKTDYRLNCVLAVEGQAIVGTDNGSLVVFDTETWEEIQSVVGAHEGAVRVLAKGEGGIFASGGAADRKIVLWSGTMQKLRELSGHHSGISDVKIVRQGKQTLVISSAADNTVRIWDLESGSQLVSYSGHKSDVLSVSYSSKHKCVVSGSQDKTLRTWDAKEFKVCRQLKRLEGHGDSVTGVVVLQENGDQVLSCSLDQSLRLWDIQTGQQLRVIKCANRLRNMVQFCEGIVILIGKEQCLQLWDYNIKTLVHSLPGKKKVSSFGVTDQQQIFLVEEQYLNLFY